MHLIPSEIRIGGIFDASVDLDETRNHPKDLKQQVKAAEVAVAKNISQIEQVESAVKSATNELERARADFVRAAKLVKDEYISKRAYYHTKASPDVAHAGGDKSTVQLIQAKSPPMQAEAELAQADAESPPAE